jgi:hypothetical protein
MIKKMIKLGLACLIILGIAFSVSNVFQNDANAAMTEDKLTIYGDVESGNYAFKCGGDGRGCFTVIHED